MHKEAVGRQRNNTGNDHNGSGNVAPQAEGSSRDRNFIFNHEKYLIKASLRNIYDYVTVEVSGD